MKNRKISNGETEREKANHVAKLIGAYIGGTITTREIAELEYWLNQNDLNKELFRYFTNPAFLLHLRQQCWN